MAVNTLNDNIQLNANKALDNRSGIYSGSTWIPYSSSAHANSSISSSYRYIGLPVLIGTTSSYITYTYQNGITDSDLLPYTASYATTASAVLGGTANYIPVWTGNNTLSSSLIYQSGSNLGISTTTPFSGNNVRNSIEVSGSSANITVSDYAVLGKLQANGYGAVGSNFYLDTTILKRKNADHFSAIDFSAGGFLFKSAGSSGANTSISTTTLVQMLANGNMQIGTTTDSGYKLNVSGSTRITGISASNDALYIGNGTAQFTDLYPFKINNGSYDLKLGFDTTGYRTVLYSQVGLKIAGQNTGFFQIDNIASSSYYDTAGFYTANRIASWSVGHLGAFGFETYGTTTRYNAISHIYADNANSGLLISYKSASVSYEGIRVTATGNVGINTPSPTSKLDVSGTIKATDTITSNNTILSTDGTIQTVMSYGSRGIIGTQTNHALELRTNNTGRVYIGSSGGTTFNYDTAFGGSFNGVVSIRKDAGLSSGSTYRNGQLAVGLTSSNGAVVIGYSSESYGSIQAATMGVSFSPLALQAFGGAAMIGTVTPDAYKLDVANDATYVGIRAEKYIVVRKAGSTGTDIFAVTNYGSSEASNFGNPVGNGAVEVSTGANIAGLIVGTRGTSPFVLATLNTEAMRITTAQNVLMGTTTDGGYKLDVNGTARIVTRLYAGSFTPGTGATSNTIATTGIIAAAGGFQLRSPVNNDSTFYGIQTATYGTETTRIAVVQSATVAHFGGYGGSAEPVLFLNFQYNPSAGTADKYALQIGGSIQTSGTFSGTVTGLYYNPTLTSLTGVSSHRAIHTVTGDVMFATTSGSVLIGTTTNSGYKLNVNGSASVSSSLVVTGSVGIRSGSVTMPNRPAFRVTGTSSSDITAVTVLSGSLASVDYNQGNAYDNTTGLFTAPVAGLYHVFMNIRCGSVNSQQQVIMLKNSATSMLMWEAAGNTGAVHFGVSGIINLAVGDTLKAQVQIGSIQFDGNDSWGAAYIG